MAQSPNGQPAATLEIGLPRALAVRLHELMSQRHEPLAVFVYDTTAAAAQARRLVAALPDWAEVFYAVKANAYPPVLRALASEVAGFEVASAQEAELALQAAAEAGVSSRLTSSGPGKTEQNLTALIAADAEWVNVESTLELHRLARLAQRARQRVPVAIRVSPAPVRLSRSLRIGGKVRPFGVAEEDVPALVRAARELDSIEVVGFHFHELCNNVDAKDHADYIAWCLGWSHDRASNLDVDLRVVDVGGGIGAGSEQQPGMDPTALGHCLRELSPPDGCRVVLEPGRYLVADCGHYAAEVTDVKRVAGTWFAVLSGGINHFLRPALGDHSGTISVLPVDGWDSALPRPAVNDAPVTVVGALCSPSDVLARDVPVHEVRAGDLMVFSRAGSYGWELAIQQFLGHPRAHRTTI